MAITAENTNYTSATTTVSPSFVISNIRFGAVPDRFLAVTVVTRSNTNTVTQVVWQPNGDGTGQQFLTLIQGVSHASQNLRVELWGLVAPTASLVVGSRVAVAWSVAGDNATLGVTEFAGVHQTTPWPGYPSTYSSTDQSASPLVGNTTATLAVTSVAGNLVLGAIAKDVSINTVGSSAPTDRINTATAGMRDYFNRLSPGGGGAPTSAAVHGAMVTSLASGVTTNLSYTFLQTSGGALNGRSYVQIGVPLSQSTSVAPYYVEPPSVEVRLNGSNFAGAAFPTSNNTAFSTAGVVTVGPQPQNITNTRVATYASKVSATQSTFNFSAAGGGSFNTGELVYESLLDYPGTVAGTTATARIPSTAAADDIAIVAVYSEDEVFDIQPAIGGAFTAIQTTDVGGGTPYRMRTFYRRLIGGDISTSFTFNTSTASGERRELLVALYRGCVTTGSPIGATTAAPTTATGTSTTPTATGLTTTQADMTVVMVTGTLDNRVTTAPVTLDERLEHGRRIWMADSAVLTASATGNQAAVVSPSTTWAAQLIALIPAVGGATLPRNAARATTAFTSAASRAGSSYFRSSSRTTSAFAAVASRLASYRRTASRTTAAFASAATRSVILRRTASRTTATFTSSARRRGTFIRNAVRASGPILAFATWRGVLFRSAVRATTTFTATARRRGNPFRRAAVRATTTFTATARRRGIFRRSSSRTTIAISLVASRRYTAKRTALRQTIGGGVYTAHMTVQGVGITWSPFSLMSGGFANIPILRLIDSTDYLNPTFYFEANIQSSSSVLPAYARLWDVTAGGPVTGSQITTSASHAVAQRVRSGSLPIISGHVYRAELGKASGHQTAMASADVIVEVPT